MSTKRILVGIGLVMSVWVVGMSVVMASQDNTTQVPSSVVETVPEVVQTDVMQVEPTPVVVDEVIGGVGQGGAPNQVFFDEQGGATPYVGGGIGTNATLSVKIATCGGSACNAISFVQNGNVQPPANSSYTVTSLDGVVETFMGN